ncbi:MAG TPA: peptide-binding protein [Myxococcales bacterium]|nr:peptide-binding protein [Myxococcales bacterium]
MSRSFHVAWAVLLAACSSRSPVARAPIGADWQEGRLPVSVYEGEPQKGGTMVVRLDQEPPSLDKLTDSALAIDWLLERKVLESMAELDASKHPDYSLKPALATDWNISPDQLTYTFHLRRGVKWHDGAPFSGRDVVATLRKIQDPSVRAMHLRNNFEDLADISTAPGDDFTVIAHYRKPYFLAFRALATLSIYPAHLLETAGDMMHSPMHRAPVGTGPFRFEEWKSGDRISFVRNDQYWGRKAHLDRVVYRIVPDSAVAFQLLKRGEFDLYLQLQPQQWARDLEAAGLKASLYRIKFFNPNYNWIGWNEERPYFSDPRVRQAMNYVIDTEGIRNSFLLGLDRPTTCIFYLESSACDRSLVPRPYDPAQAARLLDEAGWRDHDGDGLRDKDGVPFRFTFLMNSDSVFLAKLAPYLQQELRKLGVEMEIRKVDWALFVQLVGEHRFDAMSLRWGNSDVVQDPYEIWHSSQAKDGSNFVSFKNAEADALIEQARATLDDARRNELYRKLGRLLYEEAPYTFLYNRPSLDAVRVGVRGIRPSVAWYDMQDVWLARR